MAAAAFLPDLLVLSFISDELGAGRVCALSLARKTSGSAVQRSVGGAQPNGAEIHDTLVQGFVAVSVQLEAIARLLPVSVGAAEEMLGQIRAQVRNSLAEARQSIWQLRSEGADQRDLAAKLTKMAA